MLRTGIVAQCRSRSRRSARESDSGGEQNGFFSQFVQHIHDQQPHSGAKPACPCSVFLFLI
jgi:hypothetical protein